MHKKQKRLAENLQEDKLDSGLELSSWASEGTYFDNSDPKFNKTLIKPSLDWKVSTIELPLLTISERESSTYIKPALVIKTKDLEYFIPLIIDHMGQNHNYSRKHRSRPRQIRNQSPS